MKNYSAFLSIHTISAAAVAAVVMYLFVTSIQQNRLYELELLTRAQLAEQETVLAAIAETTARNGADAVTESIVRDCTLAERTSFDDLLNRLDAGLVRSELIELERLFGRCGRFYAERKSVMVARLEREIGVYESLIEQASTVAGTDVGESHKLSQWQTLSQLETQQSQLFSELVSSQDKIIAVLLGKNTDEGVSLADVQAQANAIQDNLVVTNKQAASVRADLLQL